jgi:hypothetical protein
MNKVICSHSSKCELVNTSSQCPHREPHELKDQCSSTYCGLMSSHDVICVYCSDDGSTFFITEKDLLI